MSIAPLDLLFYAGALFILFMTPGPVWLALIARGLSGGFPAAWPLAFGVTVGDALWPLLAILGISWLVAEMAWALMALRLLGAVMFLWMGVAILRHADRGIAADGRLTRPGRKAGFLAGVAVILSNPKAILFYMGLLPGFFDLAALKGADIAAIMLVSMAVPLIGNLVMALFIDRARALLSSPRALRRLNVTAGCLMILVAAVLPFT